MIGQAKLVLLHDGAQEVVIIDTTGMNDDQLEREYGSPVVATIVIEGNVNAWPTDRVLMEEK